MRQLASMLAALALLASTPAVFAAGSSSRPAVEKHITQYNKGVKLLKKGKYDKAEEKFRKALEADEGFAEAHNNLGYCLRKQGLDHYPEALKHYNRALELNPNLAEAYMYRGVLFLNQGDKEQAMADHATLEGLNPDLAAALQRVIETGEEKDANEYYGLVEAMD